MNKRITYINFTIVAYFLLVGLIYLYQIDFVLVGVFIEFFAIPFLVAAVVFVCIGMHYLINKKLNYTAKFSVWLLLFCLLIIIGSFYVF